MRRIHLTILLALAACTQAPPKRTYPDDARALAHLERGRAFFAAAETSPVPSEAFTRALAEFEAARDRIPAPEHRFAHARTALILDPASKPAREELAAVVEECPDDPRFVALDASVAAQDGAKDALDRASKAIGIALLVSDRAVRAFVGDQVSVVAAVVARTDKARGARLCLEAGELPSPWALVNAAKVYWTARAPLMDHAKAIEVCTQAAGIVFTDEDAGRALIYGMASAVRGAARELGLMLAEDARFEEASAALVRGLTHFEDDCPEEGERPNAQVVLALATFGAIEAEGLGAGKNLPRGTAALEQAAKLGHVPSLVLLARLEPDAAKAAALFTEARNKGAPGGYAGLGQWKELEELATADADTPGRDAVLRVRAQRTAFFARAVRKGGGVRIDTEKEAREAVLWAPDSMPLGRQLRHVAGDLSREDLEATMPRSAHVPRWRAETELALALRRLIVADRGGAKEHLENVLKAHALFSLDDDLAAAALRELAK